MLQKIKDYIKCSVRNKAVIGSYASLSLSALLFYIGQEYQMPTLQNSSIIPLDLGIIGLLITQAGRETYNAYKRMQNHIKKYETIDKKFKNTFSSEYCTQSGIKLAAKESGLEHLL